MEVPKDDMQHFEAAGHPRNRGRAGKKEKKPLLPAKKKKKKKRVSGG